MAACSLIIFLAVLAAACGSSGPSEGALAGKTATAITSLSVTAFHQQRSLAFVTKTILGKTTTVETGATTRSGEAAAETVTTNGQLAIDAVLVNHVVYVRAVTSFLEHALNLPSTAATANAGKWISVTQGDATYRGLVASLAPTQAIQQFVPEEPNLRVAGAASVGGRNAVAVVGSPQGQVSAGDTAATTLFVSTTAPHLPISSTVVVKNATGKTIERLASVYGKYNDKVDPIAPKGATPLSSIGG